MTKEKNGWTVNVGIRPSRNALSLVVPLDSKNLTISQSDFIDTVLNKYGNRVFLSKVSEKSRLDDDCNNHYCDAPLRGGVRIDKVEDNTGCTSGFIVRGYATGNRYVLTAGHCSHGYTGSTWTSQEDVLFFPVDRTIGTVSRNEVNNNIDAMIILRDNNQSWLWTTAGAVYMRAGGGYGSTTPPSRTTMWDIARTSSNSGLEGERICVTGFNGSSCGFIIDVNVTKSVDGYLFHNQVRAAYCATKGDSGAPVVRGNYTHHALGIHSNGADVVDSNGQVVDKCSNVEHYTGINSIISAFDNTFELVTW